MDQSVCKLTIVCPPAAGDNIAELMLGLDPPVAGFTTFAAEGHGLSFDTASVGERVRGRVKRTVIVAVLPRMTAERLVEIVRREIAVPHMAYWIEPVLACGRMGERPTGAADLGKVSAAGAVGA
ncbi:MAG: hypothetical protein CTY20_14655 [Hyphomicrobium sp.]|nr:DUF3240 family protein [Hyphomicrobium sp.]PPD26282.1 MAG: hypothetical protein CTY20_14655 [Hyphomicrobium sp.]